MDITIVYCGYIGIMEKRMETKRPCKPCGSCHVCLDERRLKDHVGTSGHSGAVSRVRRMLGTKLGMEQGSSCSWHRP